MTTATAEAALTPVPTPTATPTGQPTPAPYGATAFEDPDSCTNDEWGWKVAFPESWWTNTAFMHSDGNRVSACWMFSADEFDPRASRSFNARAPGAEIHLGWVEPPGLVGTSGEIVSEEEVTVDGHTATRREWAGTDSGETLLREGERVLEYRLTFADNDQFIAWADNRFGDDFEATARVLDAMMETIEFRDY